MKTIKVKPWGEGQGDHVLINESDFDPKVHQAIEDKPAQPSQPEQPKEQPKAESKQPAKKSTAKG